MPVLQVVDVRYQAGGQFGGGFKPHDLRQTFSTWLEAAGIPARVIDELMGHGWSRRGELEGGSRIGARYRHTTTRSGRSHSRRDPGAETILQVDSGGRVS